MGRDESTSTTHRLSTAWRWRFAVLGGGLAGAAIRVSLEVGWGPPPGAWPWPTFVVNLAGAFLLGLLLPRLASLREPTSILLPFVGIGLLGALTTFSLFIYEAWLLTEHGRAALAAGYVTATLVAGLAVALLGDRLAHRRHCGTER